MAKVANYLKSNIHGLSAREEASTIGPLMTISEVDIEDASLSEEADAGSNIGWTRPSRNSKVVAFFVGILAMVPLVFGIWAVAKSFSSTGTKQFLQQHSLNITAVEEDFSRRLQEACVAGRSDLRLREEPQWCWQISDEGEEVCEASYARGDNQKLFICYWFKSPTTGIGQCKGQPDYSVCTADELTTTTTTTTTMDAAELAVTCASLFNKDNLRQQNKWCWEMGKEKCGVSYVGTKEGTFRQCQWDNTAKKCLSDEAAIRCTPKRGHALSRIRSPDQCADMKLLGPNHWFYGWGPQPKDSFSDCAGLHDSGFVPQLWGGKHILTADIWHPAEAILGFNEPDNHEEAHLTAADAAALWPDLESRASELNIPRIGSPATTTPTIVDGNKQMVWYDKFFAACGNCKVDFLVVHMYKTNVQDAKDTLTALHERYNLPLWVKEFNSGGLWSGNGVNEQLEYMEELVKFMEKSSFIERYAWMSARNNLYETTTLIDHNTNLLTQLGELYQSMPMNVGK